MPPITKPSQGTPILRSPVGSASFQSTLVDMVNEYRRRVGAGAGGVSSEPVQVENLSGADLARGHVCQLGDALLDDMRPGLFWFEGNAVADPVYERFVIAAREIPQNEVGPVISSGPCIAVVDVQATTDRWAFPVDGDYVLTSGPAGMCELLSPPDGTGEQEMIVCLGRACPDLDGVLDEDCNAGSSATMSVYIGGSDSGENIEVEGTYIPSSQKIASTTRIGTKADNASGVHHIDVSKACPVDQ